MPMSGMHANSDNPWFKRFDSASDLYLVEPLTELLHEAYAPLAARGMKYLATHQPPSKTLERLKDGESYLAFLADELIGTVTLYKEKPQSGCEYYRNSGVYSFGQFAIRPDLQGRKIGSRLMDFIEQRARELGANEIALDTSEHAYELIAMYGRRDYRHVAYTQWEVTNYRSVILSKQLV